MIKEVEMTFDEAVEYIRNNVHVRDTLEVSYNRIFAPGEVLGITIEIDFKEIADDLIEMRHIHDDEELIIEIL